MALSWKIKPCVDPKVDAADSLNCRLDRVWATLAPLISVVLETEVSIVKDRSLSEKALDRSPQLRKAKPGPEAVVSPLQFVTRRHIDQDVRFRRPRRDPSSPPELKSLAFDDLLPESPFENGARLPYRSPR